MHQDDPWIEAFRATAAGWLLGGETPPEGLPAAILLPMENPDVYDDAWLRERARDLEVRGTVTTGRVEGVRVAVSSSKFGAPAVAMAVDVFAKAGFRAVVGVGFCGGLCADLECGTLVIPYAAVRGEGASRTYISRAYPAACSPAAFALAAGRAQEQELPIRTGIVWTTDGILRETRPQVEYWHQAGVLGVDMETSALYTVAALHRMEAVAILVASDNVYTCRQTDLDRLRAGWRCAAALALDVCRELSRG